MLYVNLAYIGLGLTFLGLALLTPLVRDIHVGATDEAEPETADAAKSKRFNRTCFYIDAVGVLVSSSVSLATSWAAGDHPLMVLALFAVSASVWVVHRVWSDVTEEYVRLFRNQSSAFRQSEAQVAQLKRELEQMAVKLPQPEKDGKVVPIAAQGKS
ncbi:MAG TPA: hypothetical protein VN495_00100 [Candidatus Paceibacterota bacterium]|nr:hypothetical protein [Candidatus Paceibacterota bacterium]